MPDVPLFATSLDPVPRPPHRGDRRGSCARAATSSAPRWRRSRREFAAYLGVRALRRRGNGTDALTIALRALGVGPGDEVVMPSFTFYATAEAAIVAGATPVFCDIDPATFCVTAETVKAVAHAAHQGDRAGAPVRQRGPGARAARARGAGARGRGPGRRGALRGIKAGALGDAATFSFFPVEEPALPRRRRRDRHRRRRRGGRGSPAALPRLDGQADLHGGGLQLAPRRAAGGGAAGAPARARRLERAPPRGRGGLRAARAGRARTAAGARSTAPSTSTTCTWCARRSSRSAAATTACRCTASRRSAAAVELPGTEEAARTNHALPMGIDLTEEQIREVVAACASGST